MLLLALFSIATRNNFQITKTHMQPADSSKVLKTRLNGKWWIEVASKYVEADIKHRTELNYIRLDCIISPLLYAAC